MIYRTLNTTFFSALLLAITACGGGAIDGNAQSTSTNTPSAASSTLDATMVPTLASMPTQTPAPLPELVTLPPFDPAGYENSEDAEEFLQDLGKEREFPREFLDGAPELSRETVKTLMSQFFEDTRVVTIKLGIRDSRIIEIMDICDNGGTTRMFWGDRRKDVERVAGRHGFWSIEFANSSAWNVPLLSGSYARNRNAFLTRGWEAVKDATPVQPPNEDGYVGHRKILSTYIRVFDNPDCADPKPVLQQSAAQWTLLGLESMNTDIDELRVIEEGTTDEQLLEMWDQALSDSISFSNMQGLPAAQFCGNHRGVGMSPYFQHFGETFTWRLSTGTDLAPNGVWIHYEMDNPALNQSPEFLYIEENVTEFRSIVSANSPECSEEAGLAYVESIREQYGR